jgi:hypothetical protein
MTRVRVGCGPRRTAAGTWRSRRRGRTWRISSSYEAISANDGHAAITRPVAAGSATATFAVRLAALPATSSARGRIKPRPSDRDSASAVVGAASIIPSTDIGVSAATYPGWPCSSTSRCICRYDTVPAISASMPDASDGGPPA